MRKTLLASLALLCLAAAQAQPGRVYTSLAQIKDPRQVYHLRVRHKRLRHVPAVVFQCGNLRTLDLSKNFIDTLSPAIASLSHLEVLNLNRNKLRHVPPELGRLASLRVLDLGRNPLLELPPELGALRGLRRLALWMTGVVELPPTFVALDATLQELDLRACPLTYDNQEAIAQLLPTPKKRWNYVCNCQ